MANGSVSIRARIMVNVPSGREVYHFRDSRSISLERAYMVSEVEAREAAKQWREANPELNVRAVYTVEI